MGLALRLKVVYFQFEMYSGIRAIWYDWIGQISVMILISSGSLTKPYLQQTNFITANFREEAGKSVNTEQMPLTELLSRSPTPKMKPARTYGCLNADWVDDTCYIRLSHLTLI